MSASACNHTQHHITDHGTIGLSPWLYGACGLLWAQVGGWVVEYRLPWEPSPSSDAQLADPAADTQADNTASGANAKQRGGFLFATVRGAGHMVPYTQPQRAMHLVTRFLRNQPL
jgi:hypothetical protein